MGTAKLFASAAQRAQGKKQSLNPVTLGCSLYQMVSQVVKNDHASSLPNAELHTFAIDCVC